MKLIRLPGLLAFILIVAALAFLLFVSADRLVIRGSRAALEKISGTQVDIADADLTLNPLGITLEGIQITSSADPMRNAAEIKRCAFNLDPAKLCMRKIIIEELSLLGVTLDTPRKTPGKIRAGSDSHRIAAPRFLQEAVLPSIRELDVREILQQENLETIRLAENTRLTIDERQTFWQDRLKALPDKPKITEYRRRLQQIKKTDTKDIQAVLKGTQDLNILKNDILKDVRLVKATRYELEKDYKDINARVDQAKQAPSNDIKHLKKKYGPSPAGAGNISRLIFGDKAGIWTERVLTWYAKINPALQKIREDRKKSVTSKPPRAKGLDVHFPEHDPLPDFLIRQAAAEVLTRKGDFAGRFKNVTNQQQILNKPLEFSFSGSKLERLESFELTGILNRINPANAHDAYQLSFTGYDIDDLKLSSGSLPLILSDGLADLEAEVSVTNGVFDAAIAIRTSRARFTTELKDSAAEIYRALAAAIGRIDGFSLTAKIDGSPDDYSIGITSDLDRILKQVVNDILAQYKARFEKELEAAVAEKVTPRLEELDRQLEQLEAIDKEMADRLRQIEELLNDSAFKGLSKGLDRLPF